MPFNAREFGYAWHHIGLGAMRRLARQSRGKFIDSWREKGVPMRPLVYEGQVQHCQLCGYALAEVELPPQGWLLQACSAVGFQSLIDNDRLKLWTRGIGVSEDSSSHSNLPTIGV